MVKGPGLYYDIGQRVKDLLYKDYRDCKLTVTNYSSNGLETTSSITRFGGLSFGINQLKWNNITTDIKVDEYSSLATNIVIEEPAPGFKAIFRLKLPYYRHGYLELQYLDDYVGICTRISLFGNPVVDYSCVVGNSVTAIGTDVSYNTKTGKWGRYNAKISFSSADLIASLTLEDKGDTLTVPYYQTINPLTNTVVGAEFHHYFSNNQSYMMFGAQHSLSPLTTVKAYVDSLENAWSLVQHECSPNVRLTISGSVNKYGVAEGTHFGPTFLFGLALALKL